VAALTVDLRSQSSGALSFFSDAACTTTLASVPLAPTAATGTFYVRAATPGTGYVRASVAASPLTAGLLALGVSP